MPSKTDLQTRRERMRRILDAVISRDEFDRDEIMSLCAEPRSLFVNNVLKQLSAEHVLGRIHSGQQDSPPRFAWIVDRHCFDSDHWIHQQFNGGHQVTQAPKEERPRERLLEVGATALKNGELLAILIRSGLRGESAVQSGQRLASHFENRLEELPLQAQAELKSVSKAVSEVAYCQIMAGIELGRRVAEAAAAYAPKARINSTKAAIDFCGRHFARLAHDSRQEEFHIVTLDTKLQPIQSHQITIGTLDASLVHPREVFRAAIRDSSSAILLVHNHPSGDPTPSRQDREVTERLKSAGELLGIRVIDHIIVAKNDTLSLAEFD